MFPDTPVYHAAAESGSLSKRVKAALAGLSNCNFCPRRCGVDRLAGEVGFCRTGSEAWVSSYNPHFGEEAPLVGGGGSGTIFFTHCNLGCNFCQNYDISHGGAGRPVTDGDLADIMLELQKTGCHNINFVTPTHVVPQIIAAVETAHGNGLSVPLVYNTGGYDRVSTLKLLDGIIDIYMPDFKFWNPKTAQATCDAPDYPQAARAAVTEMHRQVGDLVIDESGIAKRGLLVRHLVMPAGLAGTREIMRFLHGKISPHTYVNIMPQYRPCGEVKKTNPLNRPLLEKEFAAALDAAEMEGIHRLDRRRRTFLMW